MTLVRNAPPKPPPGEFFLERKDRRRKVEAHEEKTMRDARRRDVKCRRPRCPYCPRKPRLEVCHLKERHRSLGGNPAMDRTTLDDLILLDFISHREYDTGDLVIERLTPQGFSGPCAFYTRNDETGKLDHIGTETRIGVSVERGR